MGTHNKETHTRVYSRTCERIDIRVYPKYARIIRVCEVQVYLSCTVENTNETIINHTLCKGTWMAKDGED